jgi:membrane protease YdiL (CAAX protease family)
MKNRRFILVVAAVAALAGVPERVQAQEREAIATIVSYSAFQTGVIASGFVPDAYVVPTIMAGSLLQTAPLWTIDLPEGALYSGLTGLGFGGYFLAPEDSILGDSLGDFGLKMGLWSNYRTYAAWRSADEPGWEPEPFVGLMTAPFDWDDMNQLSVWTVLAAGTLVNVGFNLLSAEEGEAVWDTGTAYLGDVEVAPVLGVAAALAIGIVNNSLTGATEEAVYRGVQYETLQNQFGRGAARWIDSLAFSAIHVPGDIYRGVDPVSIGLTFAYRMLVSLGLQWAYDSAGLQSAAGLHTWLNVASEVAEYLVSSGVSRSDRNASLEISPMSIGMRVKY